MGDRRAVVLVLLCALAMGALSLGVRLPRGVHAYTADEVGHLLDGGPVEQFLAEETGVNPPLFRAMTSGEPTPGARVEAGRAISLEASAVAGALLVVLGWLVTGRAWAGVFAALPFALVETSIRATAQARSYGLLAALSAAWLVALHLWLRDPEDRRAQVAVALLAIPLPWVHYMAVPWLLVVGLGVAIMDRTLRRLPLLLAPSAITTLPLAWMVLTSPGRRVEPLQGGVDLLDGLLGWYMKTPLISGWHPPDWIMEGRPSVLTPWVALLMLVPVLRWRTASLSLRAQILAAWSVPVLLVALNTQQAVRDPSLVFLLVVSGPLMASVPASLPRAWQGIVAGVGLVALLAMPQIERARKGQDRPYVHPDAVRAMAAMVREGVLPPGDLTIHTSGMVVPFSLYVTGRIPADLSRRGCGDEPSCVVMRDRKVLARDRMVGETRWVIDFTHPEFHLPGCVVWPEAPEGAEVLDCAEAVGVVPDGTEGTDP